MKKLYLLFFIPFLLGAIISEPPKDDSLSISGQQYLQEIYNNFNNLKVVTTDPNGNRRGNYGDLIDYNNNGIHTVKICTSSPSGTSWANSGGAAGTDLDEKVKVSSNDTTAGYLNGKLVAGSNITLTENNDGGNETLTIAASLNNAVTQVNATNTAGTQIDATETAFLSVNKTITSGKTVLLIATGYNNSDSTGGADFTIRLKYGTTAVQTVLISKPTASKRYLWAVSGIVTGLSGTTTFSVTSQNGQAQLDTLYGNLEVLEF